MLGDHISVSCMMGTGLPNCSNGVKNETYIWKTIVMENSRHLLCHEKPVCAPSRGKLTVFAINRKCICSIIGVKLLLNTTKVGHPRLL